MSKTLQILQEQQAASTAIAREILGDIKLDVTNSHIAVSHAMEEAVETYSKLLEQQEKELIAELHRTVLHLSAKIAATRHLLRLVGREMGIQDGLRMAQDDEGGEHHEQAEANANRGHG